MTTQQNFRPRLLCQVAHDPHKTFTTQIMLFIEELGGCGDHERLGKAIQLLAILVAAYNRSDK